MPKTSHYMHLNACCEVPMHTAITCMCERGRRVGMAVFVCPECSVMNASLWPSSSTGLINVAMRPISSLRRKRFTAFLKLPVIETQFLAKFVHRLLNLKIISVFIVSINSMNPFGMKKRDYEKNLHARLIILSLGRTYQPIRGNYTRHAKYAIA